MRTRKEITEHWDNGTKGCEMSIVAELLLDIRDLLEPKIGNNPLSKSNE